MIRKVLAPSTALLVLLLFMPRIAVSQEMKMEKKEAKKMMSTYMVKLPHSKEECLAMLDDISAKGTKMLDKIEWGCMSGDHTGYVMVEAEDETAALAMLPEAERKTANVTKLTKFSPEQIKMFHEGMKK